MSVTQMSNPRLRAQFSPQPASRAIGTTQRQRLQSGLSGIRWWSVLGGVIGALLFTVLAVRHTEQVTAAAADGGSASAIPSGPGVPSQSLFQEQVSNGGGFLAPSGGAYGRSRYRSSSS